MLGHSDLSKHLEGKIQNEVFPKRLEDSGQEPTLNRPAPKYKSKKGFEITSCLSYPKA